jgi:hypothetical protein
MKTELCLTVAAIAAVLPLIAANASQTINFGPSVPTGTVPDGFAGFDWHGAQNGVFFTSNDFDSVSITEISAPAAFDLDSAVFQNLISDVPSIGDTSNFTTVISGFLNGTLVESITENYGWGSANLLSLNVDGVSDVKFTTTGIFTSDGKPGVITRSPDFTFASQITVDKFSPVTAPEVDLTAAASALTLLIGSFLVINGSRAKRPATSA